MSKPTARELLDVEPDTEMDVESILAIRVENVLALHKQELAGLPANNWCPACRVSWPCPTVRLLNGEGP